MNIFCYIPYTREFYFIQKACEDCLSSCMLLIMVGAHGKNQILLHPIFQCRYHSSCPAGVHMFYGSR